MTTKFGGEKLVDAEMKQSRRNSKVSNNHLKGIISDSNTQSSFSIENSVERHEGQALDYNSESRSRMASVGEFTNRVEE